jgi:hypothetical protein
MDSADDRALVDGELMTQVHHLPALFGVEATGRLVEHDHCWILEESTPACRARRAASEPRVRPYGLEASRTPYSDAKVDESQPLRFGRGVTGNGPGTMDKSRTFAAFV